MNREFVEKWVAELRSGKYKQNRDGQFAYPQYWIGETESYCCIGLANHLLGNENPANCLKLKDTVPELESLHLPVPARYDDECPARFGEQTSLWCHLTARNDGDSHSMYSPQSFSQIADFIEETLLVGPKQFSEGPSSQQSETTP
jgi:hypothetical protein